MIKRKICFITTSRADFGILSGLIKKFKKDKSLITKLIVTGSHLSNNFGKTVVEIKNSKIKIDYKVKILKKINSDSDINKTLSITLNKFNELFNLLKPNLIILLGDRYETLGVAISALNLKIPIAHIHGGEKTTGSVDDIYRHCITKMSNLHFTSNIKYKKRINQLGEDPNYIYNVGSLGVENIKKSKFKSRKDLQRIYSLNKEKKIILVSLHPETYGFKTNKILIESTLASLRKLKNFNLIFTSSNADLGGEKFNKEIKKFVKTNKSSLFLHSLGHENYLSLLKTAELLIGNSSSGIIEAPSLKTPTINIGNRQNGREKSKSIINCEANTTKITKAITKGLSKRFYLKKNIFKNPYEKSNTLDNIYKMIKNLKEYNINKIFFDL